MATKAQTTATRDALDARASLIVDELLAMNAVERAGIKGAEAIVRLDQVLAISNALSVLIARMV